MSQNIQIIILGLTLGGVFALMASGLTLIFGVMGIINLAHAAFIMVAAFMTFGLFKFYSVDPILSIVVVMPAMFLIGIVVYKLLFARSIRRSVA
jgi:branched-chain amino acid transport system permease protein